MWQRNKREGFTLVESMVVVGLFAIIGVSLFSSFATGMKVWKRAVSPNASYRKSLLALERLSTELRRVRNYPAIGFTGEKESLFFANVVGDKITNISYYFNSQEGGLYRQSGVILKIDEAAGEVSARKIVPSLKNAEFAYYGLDKEKGRMDFLDAWNYSASGFPGAVRASLELESGEVLEKIIILPVA